MLYFGSRCTRHGLSHHETNLLRFQQNVSLPYIRSPSTSCYYLLCLPTLSTLIPTLFLCLCVSVCLCGFFYKKKSSATTPYGRKNLILLDEDVCLALCEQRLFCPSYRSNDRYYSCKDTFSNFVKIDYSAVPCPSPCTGTASQRVHYSNVAIAPVNNTRLCSFWITSIDVGDNRYWSDKDWFFGIWRECPHGANYGGYV